MAFTTTQLCCNSSKCFKYKQKQLIAERVGVSEFTKEKNSQKTENSKSKVHDRNENEMLEKGKEQESKSLAEVRKEISTLSITCI